MLLFNIFGRFYNKEIRSKMAKKRRIKRGLQAGVFKVPSKVKTWVTGVVLTNWGLSDRGV